MLFINYFLNLLNAVNTPKSCFLNLILGRFILFLLLNLIYIYIYSLKCYAFIASKRSFINLLKLKSIYPFYFIPMRALPAPGPLCPLKRAAGQQAETLIPLAVEAGGRTQVLPPKPVSLVTTFVKGCPTLRSAYCPLTKN